MPTVILKTLIAAPMQRCFDLARSIDLHVHSMKFSKEEAIAGRKSGLIDLHETVTWKARNFGINFTMTSKVNTMESPVCFIDEMIKGPFKKLHHQHLFTSIQDVTEMTDIFEFNAPAGIFGLIVEQLFLKEYMVDLLRKRNLMIKAAAENGLFQDLSID